MAISWDPSLAVGVPDVDAQHVELFDRLDRLLEAARGGRSTAEVGRLLGFLEQYVVTHFGAEESLMAARGFPDLDAHRAEHARFVADLEALLREFLEDGGTALLVVRVNARVTAWLREHIYRADQALGRFLADPSAARAYPAAPPAPPPRR